MKKIIALVLSVLMICCLSVTAFAAESPIANEKITVIVRKAEMTDPTGKVDTEYTLDVGTTVIVKADSKYGIFNNWSIYKADASAAVAGTDYEIVKGSLTTGEITIKLNAGAIICGNYNNVKTDPTVASGADGSDSAPQTGDMTIVYVMVAMLAVAVFGFGAKKVYSK